jgi:hypothetical protein
MSGETEQQVSGWTVDTLMVHHAALREADLRFDAERDRRMTEVNVEREKALKIKETADLAALQLAREIQTYKDEKANELREQISRERGTYITHAEIKPFLDWITNQQGRQASANDGHTNRRLDVAQVLTIITVVLLAVGLVASIVIR